MLPFKLMDVEGTYRFVGIELFERSEYATLVGVRKQQEALRELGRKDDCLIGRHPRRIWRREQPAMRRGMRVTRGRSPAALRVD